MASTIGELVKAKAIALEDIQSAVDAFVANPKIGEYNLGGGYVLDLTATIANSMYARTVWEDANHTPVRKRDAVRTAILLAMPKVKA